MELGKDKHCEVQGQGGFLIIILVRQKPLVSVILHHLNYKYSKRQRAAAKIKYN